MSASYLFGIKPRNYKIFLMVTREVCTSAIRTTVSGVMPDTRFVHRDSGFTTDEIQQEYGDDRIMEMHRIAIVLIL